LLSASALAFARALNHAPSFAGVCAAWFAGLRTAVRSNSSDGEWNSDDDDDDGRNGNEEAALRGGGAGEPDPIKGTSEYAMKVAAQSSNLPIQ
jgi:hypothetical protein